MIFYFKMLNFPSMAKDASSQDLAHSARERMALSLGTSFFISLWDTQQTIINISVAPHSGTGGNMIWFRHITCL